MDEPRRRRPRERDSHDLSVQLTRFSVVDSMLLSLAGVPGESPTAALPPFDLRSPHTPLGADTAGSFLDDANPLPRRYRGHTYSSSTSDCEAPHIDDTASRYA